MTRAATDEVFRAVADPTRRLILDRLRQGDAPVHELATGIAMSRPAISKHLRILREADLVSEQRDGRQRVYALEPAPLRDVAAWLDGYRAFWQANLTSLKRFVEAAAAEPAPAPAPEPAPPTTGRRPKKRAGEP